MYLFKWKHNNIQIQKYFDEKERERARKLWEEMDAKRLADIERKFKHDEEITKQHLADLSPFKQFFKPTF